MLALGAGALVGLVILAYLYASWGVGLLLAGFLVEAFVSPTPPLAVVGSIQIYLTDIAIVAVAAATSLRLVYTAGRSRIPVPVLAMLVFVVVFGVSFVRGVMEFGPQAAGVEFRRYLGFLTAGVYLVTFRPTRERLRGLLWLWLGVAFVLCGLTLYRWGLAVLAGEVGRLRVVGARETLVLAQALLLCLYLVLVRDAGRFLRGSAAALLPFVLLLQHRTIWILLFVAVVIIAAREGRLRARLAALLAFGGVAVAVGSLLLYGEESTEVLGESASQGSTFVWRLLGWRALLQEHLGEPLATLFGEPFGAGFERFLPELGYTVNVSPHNFYVTTLLRGGIVALVCFVIIYAVAAWALYRGGVDRPESHFGYRAGFVLLITQLVYFLSYDPHHEQGIILGIAMSLTAVWMTSGKAPATEPPRSVRATVSNPPVRGPRAEQLQ